MKFNGMNMKLILREFSRCADAIKIAFKIIKTHSNRFLRRGIGAKARCSVLTITGSHLGFKTIQA